MWSRGCEQTDEDCVYILVTPTDKKDGEEEEASSSPVTGIPDFWLTAMKNTDIFADWIKVRPNAGCCHGDRVVCLVYV